MPSKTPELELKFSAPADFAAGALTSQAGIERIAELPALKLVAVYYDTDDLRLARAGVTLRYRTGDDNGAAWTLKLPTLDTPELRDEVVIGQANGNNVPDEARRLTTAFARGAELRRVARLRTRRRRWSLRELGGRELAELVDDRVSVLDGRRVTQRFHQLEIEARSSDLAGLRRIEDVLSQKKNSQPLGTHNAGCMFKNPASIPAGKLIDELGLKGTRIGGALVSFEHGNFIVNEGGATAADVLALINLVKERALSKRGIELRTEVEIIGE